MEEAIRHLMEADPVLASIIQRVGPCEWKRRPPTFETLARSITFQQLHGKAAAAIFARVKKATGRRFTARAFLSLEESELRACGLSRQKISSLTSLATHVSDRQIVFSRLPTCSDAEIIDTLCQVRGIGIWTVQMFLMFALERPDVLPATDLGIRAAVRKAYCLEDLPKPADLDVIASAWSPYRTTASWYLWRSLDGAVTL